MFRPQSTNDSPLEDDIPVVVWARTFDSESSDESSTSDASSATLTKRRDFQKPNRLVIGLRNWLNSVWGIYYRSVILAILPRQFVARHRTAVEAIAVVTSLLALLPIAWMCLWSYNHSMCYAREAITSWKEGAAHTIQRVCPAVDYPTLASTTATTMNEPPKICITTLTDTHVSSIWKKYFRCRNFDNVAALTWPNHAAYGERHGYTVLDQSHLVDTDRPPAWSKIRAVQSMLNEHECDWVMWLDADTVVMNSATELESILPSADTGIDLVVTTDRRFTANSGAWMIRNTAWSRRFLQDWWDMRSYVRANGLSLSGDNDAFGALLRKRLGLQRWATEDEMIQAATNSRIRMPARCNFNSFGVFVPDSTSDTIDPANPPAWYLSDQFYHEGDFIAHASGIDQKAAGVELLLERAV